MYEVLYDDTIDDILDNAELNWKIDKRPIYFFDAEREQYDNCYIEVDNKQALVRVDTNEVLDIVSDTWKPVQNKTLLETVMKFGSFGNSKLAKVGYIKSTNTLISFLDIKSEQRMLCGEVLNNYLCVATRHEFGYASICKLTNISAICNNVFAFSKLDGFSIAHNKEFNPEAIMLGFDRLRELSNENHKKFLLLEKLKLSFEDSIKVLLKVYEPELLTEYVDWNNSNELLSKTIKSIMANTITAEGAIVRGTGNNANAWGLLNGATYYSTHQAKTRGDRRLHNVLLEDSGKKNNQLFETLYEMAA